MTPINQDSDAFDVAIIGGGAAGIFSAIQLVSVNPDLRVIVLEKSKNLLSKVKISGGGRCNVTHACYDPIDLVTYYPRGQKELIGPFHRFMCGDMMAWLYDQGVETKTEEDGRVFPVTDSSQTIIDCFLGLCHKYRVQINTQQSVNFLQNTDVGWKIITKYNEIICSNVIVATGSSKSFWKILENLGHRIIHPVPSLFTFNISDPLLEGLQGISFDAVRIQIKGTSLSDSGPLLITHWGLSGPAVLKLSAWGARELVKLNYKFIIEVNWLNQSQNELAEIINQTKQQHGKKRIQRINPFSLTKRFYHRLVEILSLDHKNWGDLSKHDVIKLIKSLSGYRFNVQGKSTFKAEFVTCGGVDLKEVNFKTMESKLFKGLYFAGEVLDIDAITGGFNFQAAWTTGYIAAESIVSKNKKLAKI